MGQTKHREAASGVFTLRMPSGRVVEKVSEQSYKRAMQAAGKSLGQVKTKEGRKK